MESGGKWGIVGVFTLFLRRISKRLLGIVGVFGGLYTASYPLVGFGMDLGIKKPVNLDWLYMGVFMD